MKKYFTILILSTLLLSCSKDNSQMGQEVRDLSNTSWEWLNSGDNNEYVDLYFYKKPSGNINGRIYSGLSYKFIISEINWTQSGTSVTVSYKDAQGNLQYLNGTYSYGSLFLDGKNYIQK